MADQIFADGPSDAPVKYTVPGSATIVPIAVQALFNGSGASGDYVPTLIFRSQAGHVIARVPTETTVAAGASAEVSWFPGVKRSPASGGAQPIAMANIDAGGGVFPSGTTRLTLTNFSATAAGFYEIDPIDDTQMNVLQVGTYRIDAQYGFSSPQVLSTGDTHLFADCLTPGAFTRDVDVAVSDGLTNTIINYLHGSTYLLAAFPPTALSFQIITQDGLSNGTGGGIAITRVSASPIF